MRTKKGKQKAKTNPLYSLIDVDKEKCLNCHACISACPVKYCNDGSGDHVKVNPDMCIGCGQCLSACTHNARYYHDDFKQLLKDLGKGAKIVAIVAPSAAANFPEHQLHLNGWLKSIGIKACFDVSFGAELTVKSYVEYIKKNNPELVIGQACPAIVTFIELYCPELKPYLIPVDSPMVHTMKMIKNNYPQYKDHKIAAISPCLAKKREFIETNHGDYNIGFDSISHFLSDNKIDLSAFDDVEYETPPAERALGFSSPGGLLNTVKRWHPELENKTRKIEGVSGLYNYLQTLKASLKNNTNPLLVDCLNCEHGCNAGPLTPAKQLSPDDLEARIHKRLQTNCQKFKEVNLDTPEKIKDYEKLLDNFWDAERFSRNYDDLCKNNNIKIPSEEEKQDIFHKMYKFSDKDIYNCTSCGYNACSSMATAIFNKVNRPENCHFYLLKEAEYAHAEVVKREKQFSTIINTSVEGFIHVDNDFKILNVNPSVCKMLKYPQKELIGKPLFEFTNAEGRKILGQQLKIRNTGKASLYELILVRQDEQELKTLFSASPLFDTNSEKIGSFAMVTDVSEIKEVEKQLFQAQKMEIIGNMAGGLAHDFNNALTGIQGSIEVLESLATTEKISHDDLLFFLNLCSTGVTRASNIVKQLFSLSRKHESEFTKIDLNQAVSNIVKMCEATFDKSITISALYSNTPAYIKGDFSQMEQVLLNLFINAMHAMTIMRSETNASGGKLTISIKSPSTKKAFKLQHPEADSADYWQLSISDTGVGMEASTLKKIFDPFYSTKGTHQGTGLGLTMVSSIIKQHEGFIDVSSEINVGTTFHLFIPVFKEQITEKNAFDANNSLYVKGKGTILIIEDDPIIRKLSKEVLKGLGYKILLAKDGLKGIEKFKAKKENIDLIILDLVLPKCTGVQVYKTIKRLTPNMKVLLTTGYKNDERVSMLRSLGLKEIMQKPFAYPELSQKISTMIKD